MRYQPAHKSLFNRRLRILSPTVHTSESGLFRLGGSDYLRPNPFESEHESSLPKKDCGICVL